MNPMKIALIGYGKMGKTIETVAGQRGHTIVAHLNRSNPEAWNSQAIQAADIAIEFTGPESAPFNLQQCFERSLPVVCGSTGWLSEYERITSMCNEKNGSLLYASNFSIGVNIFFALNKQLAKWMSTQASYEPLLEEIHHTQKKDAPSGTAITLAEQIIQHQGIKKNWVNQETAAKDELPIISKRIDDVPGTHLVKYQSEIDTIELLHTAHSRVGFATGAVQAAEFLLGKKGVFSMSDMLGLDL
jgi:4-hydroxy-tetrahydrodipicolinate reductase